MNPLKGTNQIEQDVFDRVNVSVMANILAESIPTPKEITCSLYRNALHACVDYYMTVPNACELHKFMALKEKEREDFMIMATLFVSEIYDDLKTEIKNELGITN